MTNSMMTGFASEKNWQNLRLYDLQLKMKKGNSENSTFDFEFPSIIRSCFQSVCSNIVPTVNTLIMMIL